jgi:uncharacterized protein (DUF924 family)
MKGMAVSEIQAVLDFWLDEIGPEGWYVTSEEVDRKILDRFGALTEQAQSGDLDGWAATPTGALALLILLDQFPRNLHRGNAKAFAGDEKARGIARTAIGRNHDLSMPEPGRQFFYLPFEHSESLADQDWSLALFRTRMSTLSDETMWHVEQHREVIRRFGRFPFRNAALDRQSTADEVAFLEAGGYTPGLKL